jgi:uncharacterized protein
MMKISNVRRPNIFLFKSVFIFLFINMLFADDVMTPLALEHVNVGGEIGRRIDVTIHNNLQVIDLDGDFIQPFQDKKDKGGYIGLGKTIDAAVRFAAYSADPAVIKRKEHLVAETIKAQLDDGYPGKMNAEKRMWSLWDTHEMAYIIFGLVSDYNFFGERKSLFAAQKAADYILNRWHEKPDGWPGSMHMVMANTGIDRAFMALSKATGDQRYTNFVVNELGLADWDLAIVRGRHGQFEGHAYAFMARTLAQAELYRSVGDKNLLSQANKVIDFITKQDGLLINGAVSYQECWHNNQIGYFKLGETCATAYLIRLLDNLLRLEGNSLYGDLMERTILNALFAAQSPDGRRLRYYVPFEGERIYFDRDTYCCPCNYRRIVAELPGFIYYQTDGGVAVNLYTESKAGFKLENGIDLKINQATDYPNSGQSTFTLSLSKSAQFPIKFRIPRWCQEGARLSVNDEMILDNLSGGSFSSINRKWTSGDRITLEMPMSWRVVGGRKAQSGKVAVMRGPILFALNPELNKNIDPETLNLLRLDPESVTGPVEDQTIRPNGIACRIKVWNPNSYSSTADTELLLTEFPDPAGRASYFLLPDPTVPGIVKDELILK